MKKRFSLDRKTETTLPYARFVIFCEGANTEPAYLHAYKDTLTRVLLKLKIEGGAGGPKTLAEKAIRFKKGLRTSSGRGASSSFEKDDRVWVVFDRDEHLKVKETFDNCQGARVGVAYSNPCFELWLTFHYEDFDKPIDRHKIQSHFETLCSSYSVKTGKNPDCNEFIGRVSDAEKRASKTRQRRKDEGAELDAPFTNFDLLTNAMRDLSV